MIHGTAALVPNSDAASWPFLQGEGAPACRISQQCLNLAHAWGLRLEQLRDIGRQGGEPR